MDLIKLYLKSSVPLKLTYLNIFTLLVCLFVSSKRQNGLTDLALILFGTSHDPRERLWMIKIKKICLQQNSIVIKF